jgi:hypothetical protein
MRKLVLSLVMSCFAVGVGGCQPKGATEAECREACRAGASLCTDPAVLDKCVSRCLEAADSDDAEDGKRCSDRDACRYGLCCLGFYYSKSEYDRMCK